MKSFADRRKVLSPDVRCHRLRFITSVAAQTKRQHLKPARVLEVRPPMGRLPICLTGPSFATRKEQGICLKLRPNGIFVAPLEQGEIGPDLFRAACNMGLEGIVSKRADRPYPAGRSKDWKVKNRKHPAYRRVQDRFY